MIIKVYYTGGRIDVFDTDQLVNCVPQPENLLTNYMIDLNDVDGGSLWLRSYYYEAALEYKSEPGPTGLPIARRRDGWSFLIADKDDLKKLIRLTLDNETELIRMTGELVDAASLTWAFASTEEYPSLVKIAFRNFWKSENANAGDICVLTGVPESVLEQVSALAAQDHEANVPDRFAKY